MSETGLRQVDETIHITHIWLKDIMSELGPDRQVAYHTLKAVLQTLCDRLTVEEAAHLGAQLPLLVRGLYYDGYRPASQPHKSRTCDGFLHEVQDLLKVLERHVSAGEMQQVKHMLPDEIRAQIKKPASSLCEEAG